MPEAPSKPTVLIVDDNVENINILHGTLGNDYKVKAATDGKKALKIAAIDPKPDIVLLDILMPGFDGYAVCLKMKANPATAKIPIIFVTAMTAIEDEAMGFKAGAVDYIAKPISPAIVRARVKTHLALANQQRTCEQLVERQVSTIRQGQKDAIYMLGHAGHYNDDDTGVHIWRMAHYAKALAKALDWPVTEQEELLLASPMHDTGKIGIPDAILKKPDKLTPEEWVVMKTHTTIGHKILSLSDSPIFRMAAGIAISHHERWDGNGYPHNLEGENIPESARIVSVADVFDALTMSRPYKDPWKIERAMDYITDSHGQFDPRVIEAFVGIKDEILDIKKHWDKKEPAGKS